MNKLVKGAVAGAAGIALLLGGAGTFALWNQSATASASTVTSGTLSIATAGTGTWTDVSTSTARTISDIASYRIVPGSKLKFVQQLSVNATGNDLKADFTYDTKSVTGSLASTITPVLTIAGSATTTALPSGFTASSKANTFSVQPTGSGSTAVYATVTIELPQNSDNSTQNGTLDLSKLTFLLSQTAIGS
ncbi:alternate-type signal peptide domain-containing protein [Frigoribacterium sp. 2-23]|uniref:alternate-type signal peptide domain-containing protein n=1 Tax=Frigoribacterium sp. 2-23 TaxID=3415006 RepID=UPI003C6FB7BE